MDLANMKILIFLIYCFVLTHQLQRKCHNFNVNRQNKPSNCSFINNTMSSCQICEYFVDYAKVSVTICRTDPIHMSAAKAISLVPWDTEYLLIEFTNKWFGYLPLRPDPINITGIVQLKQLRYFEITDELHNFTPYPLLFEQRALPLLNELKNLTTFRIRIPIIDIQIIPHSAKLSSIIARLTNLIFLDLSYTRGFNSYTLHEILDGLNINDSHLVHLCLRKIQLPGSQGYHDDMSNIFDYRRYLFKNLGELDLSDNRITRFPMGLSKIAPVLQMLDMSGNTLIDDSNLAFIFEVIQHPSLVTLNLKYQGREDQPNLQTPPDINRISLTEKNNIYKRSPKYKKLFLAQFKFILNCFLNISRNISDIISHANYSCMLTKCLFPQWFSTMTCDDHTSFPKLNTIFCPDCYGHIKFPLGPNLEYLFLDCLHFEQGATRSVGLEGILKIKAPNKLKIIEFRDNYKWIETGGHVNAMRGIKGIKNFDKLEILVLQNNHFNISIPPHFDGMMENLQTLNLSENVVKTMEFCKIMPNLEKLVLIKTSATVLDTNMIKNCTKLKFLDISNNLKLNQNSLMNLSFEGVDYLKILFMEKNSIKWLTYEMMEKLERFPNLSISLYDNELYCNCSEESLEFTKWFLRKAGTGHVIHYEKYYNRYHCTGPKGNILYKNVKIEELIAICNRETETIIYSVIYTLAFVGCLSSIVFLYKTRWRIKHFGFKIQQKLTTLCAGKCNNDLMWMYDAFVSYCADDRFWVHDMLVKMLENKYGFRLCIHYRDFPVGQNIADTIVKKMAESREIVIILSDIAMQSTWCQFELDEALVQIGQRQKSLIIITLGDLHKNCLNTRVAHLLENHTYIKWSESPKANKSFWSRLVARLYNDPRGNMCLTSCCCPYGANALGYRDIFDQEYDDEEFIPKDPKSSVSDAEKQCKIRMQTYERKLKQTKRFWKVINSSLEDHDISRWVFGQLPWPVMHLLRDNQMQLDAQRNHFTTTRTQLLIDCLEEQKQRLIDNLQRERAKMEEISRKELLREKDKICVYEQQHEMTK